VKAAAAIAWDALVLHPDDDVAVALHDLSDGATAVVRRQGANEHLQITQAIPLGHKLALHPLAAGAPVRKYGQAIGVATVDISGGSHVHVHNLASRRARPAR